MAFFLSSYHLLVVSLGRLDNLLYGTLLPTLKSCGGGSGVTFVGAFIFESSLCPFFFLVKII